MAGREGGISGRIGERRNPGESQRRLPTPKGPAAPGMPGFGDALSAIDASVPGIGQSGNPVRWPLWLKEQMLRDRLAELVPVQGVMASDVASRQSTGDAYRRTKERLRQIEAFRRASSSKQLELPLPGRVEAPLGSDDDRVVRLNPRYVTPLNADLAPQAAESQVFSRETGALRRPLADAIRKAALSGEYTTGKRVTSSDVEAAAAAGYDIRPVEGRPDVLTYSKPDGSEGFLVSLGAGTDEILQLEKGELLEFASALQSRLEAREPSERRDPRGIKPTASPVIRALRDAGLSPEEINQVRTPEDLRAYDDQRQQWRAINRARREPAIGKFSGRKLDRSVPPGGEMPTGNDNRAASSSLLALATRNSTGEYGQVRIDPLLQVLTRSVDPDSTAAWDRERQVTLADLISELNDKYKRPAYKGNILELQDFDGQPFVGGVNRRNIGNDTQVGTVLRSIRINEGGIADPAFMGLDLPEVAAAVQENRALPPDRRQSMVQARVPVYQVFDRDGWPTDLFRIGGPVKRNTDFLNREFNELTGNRFARTIEYSPAERVERIQLADHSDYNKDSKSGLRRVSDLQVLQAKAAGYSFSEPDENGLVAYTDKTGALAGYLVPMTIKGKGVNTGVPIPALSERQQRWLDVKKKDWEGRWSRGFEGIPAFSEDSAMRASWEKNQRLNPEQWKTLELLDEIASYSGASVPQAPLTAGVESFQDPVNPGAFDLALGAGRQTPTSAQRMSDATQALANRSYYTQPAIPGILGGVQSQPWLRRRASQGPSLGEVMEAERLASVMTEALDANARELEGRLPPAPHALLARFAEDPEMRLEDVVAGWPRNPEQQGELAALSEQLGAVRAELRARDDAAKAAEWAAGARGYMPPAPGEGSLSQPLIPGLDPEALPRPLSNPVFSDYELAMSRTFADRIESARRTTGDTRPFGLAAVEAMLTEAAQRNEKGRRTDQHGLQIKAAMNPARSVGPSIDGKGFVLVGDSPDRSPEERFDPVLVGQPRQRRPTLLEVLARPQRPSVFAEDGAPAREGYMVDPAELGLEEPEADWSDNDVRGHDMRGPDSGFQIVEPSAAGGRRAVSSRQIGLAPFAALAERLAQQAGSSFTPRPNFRTALAPGHAEQIAAAALASPANRAGPIDDMAIAKAIAQLVRPPVVERPRLDPGQRGFYGSTPERYRSPRSSRMGRQRFSDAPPDFDPGMPY